MPKRSNAFQAIVYVIHSALSDEPATVTESPELLDKVTGDPREVDITIQSNLAGYPVTIAIECRDGAGARKQRPQDVTFVDEIRGKHERLPIDVTVLVSSTGFTRQAEKKAESLGMLTLTPGQITEERARNLLHAGVTIYLWQTEYIIDRFGVTISPCTCHEETRFAIEGSTKLYFADGDTHLCVADHLAFLCRHIQGGPERLFTDESPHAIGIEPVFAPRGESNIVEDLYVRLEGELHKIAAMAIFASSSVSKVPIQLRYGVLKDIYYGTGDAEIDGERVTLVVTKRDGEDSRPILRYHPRTKKSQDSPKIYRFSYHETQGPTTD